ncbi:hypothetical protein AVEN_229046-1 [Araneus ventricosus]|uniref:Uncharacterized protein n=1 Tax=Araneus ventricosus TaxID=182803 RepID=A0A4Y2CX12_ARAVE|nr:hypothetical protein AVEN_229046-1 [Araneus ventricosus]
MSGQRRSWKNKTRDYQTNIYSTQTQDKNIKTMELRDLGRPRSFGPWSDNKEETRASSPIFYSRASLVLARPEGSRLETRRNQSSFHYVSLVHVESAAKSRKSSCQCSMEVWKECVSSYIVFAI